jgi:hypothetical protein
MATRERTTLEELATARLQRADREELLEATEPAVDQATAEPRLIAESEEVPVPVPVAAKVAFWVTVAIVALALFSIGAMAAWESYAAGYFLMFLLVFGSLFAAVLGAIGFVRSVQEGSNLGMLMSAMPCGIVAILILVRIGLSV